MSLILEIGRSDFLCSNNIHVTDICVNYICHTHVMLQGVSLSNTTICFAVVTNFLFFLNNTFPIECFTYPVLWSQGNLQAIHLLLYKLQCTRMYFHSHMSVYVRSLGRRGGGSCHTSMWNTVLTLWICTNYI